MLAAATCCQLFALLICCKLLPVRFSVCLASLLSLCLPCVPLASARTMGSQEACLSATTCGKAQKLPELRYVTEGRTSDKPDTNQTKSLGSAIWECLQMVSRIAYRISHILAPPSVGAACHNIDQHQQKNGTRERILLCGTTGLNKGLGVCGASSAVRVTSAEHQWLSYWPW